MQGNIVKRMYKNNIEYKQIDYLGCENTTSFINTGIAIRNDTLFVDLVIEVEYAFNSLTNGQAVGKNKIPYCFFGINNGKFYSGIGGQVLTSTITPDTNFHKFKLEVIGGKGKFYVDDVLASDYGSISGGSNNGNFYLYRVWNNEATTYYQAPGKCKYVKCEWKGEPFRNLIPIEKQDGTLELLDLVTDSFYGNSGSGTLVKGPYTMVEHIYKPYLITKDKEKVEQVDYIESTGTQYIDTGFVATGNIIKNYIKFVNTNVAQHDKALFGAFRNSGAVRGGYIYTDTSASKYGYRFAWGSSDSLAHPTIDGSIGEFELERNFTTKVISLSINGGTATTYINNNATKLTNSEFLFCGNANDTPTWHSSIKCYGYKIIEDGVLKLNLIPVKYGTEYCMLDLVENKLYHNAGAGTFTGGSRTEVKKITQVIKDNGAKYYLLDCLQSTGTQRIDTNISCDNIGKIETRFSIQNVIGSGGQMLYGYYHSNTASAKRGSNYLQYTSSSMYIYGGGQRSFSPSQRPLIDNIYRLQVPIAKAGTGYLFDDDGTQRATVSVVGTLETGKMTLFVIGGNSTVASHYSSAKIYYFKMYDLDDNLISDLVPAEKEDGTKGMLDLVNHTFYGNAGMGTFAGNKREIILVE